MDGRSGVTEELLRMKKKKKKKKKKTENTQKRLSILDRSFCREEAVIV